MLGVVSLRTKITATAVVTLVVAGAAVSAVVFRSSARAFVRQEMEMLGVEARIESAALRTALQHAQNDTRMLAATPVAIEALSGSHAGGVTAPLDSDGPTARQRLHEFVEAFLLSRDGCSRVRVVDVRTERTLLEVAREGDRVAAIADPGPTPLDDLFHCDPSALEPGDTLSASPRLRRAADGTIVEPRTPILVFAAPVIDSDGTVTAVAILDWDLDARLPPTAETHLETHSLRIATSDGSYVVHPEPDREFGFEFDRPYDVVDEFPELAALFPEDGQAPLAHSAEVRHPDGDLLVQSLWARYGPRTHEAFVLLLSMEHASLLAQAERMRRSGGLAAVPIMSAVPILVVCAVVAFWLSWRFTRQLAEFSKTADAVAQGSWDVDLPVDRHDELGVLARSMKSMIDRVLARNADLQEQTALLRASESSLQERTNDLHKANQDLQHALNEVAHAKEQQAADFAILGEALDSARRAAETSNVTKSQFLANMSHELRTPLNAILGYTEMLLEDAADTGDGESARDLGSIRDAGRHLLALINQVLDLSKVEAGSAELYEESIDGDALIDDVVTTIRPLAATKRNTLDVACESLGTFVADRTKLKQILINLVANACKFTEGGVVRIHGARERSFDRDVLQFQISDTGIGMTPTQVARIFRPFAQADASTTRRYGGTGLGLALSREFCRLMGGDIRVDSEEGTGSSFLFWIPLPPSLDPEAPEHPGIDVTGEQRPTR